LSLLFLFTPAIPTAGTHSACQARSKVLQTKFTHSHGPSHPLNSCSYTAFKSLNPPVHLADIYPAPLCPWLRAHKGGRLGHFPQLCHTPLESRMRTADVQGTQPVGAREAPRQLSLVARARPTFPGHRGHIRPAPGRGPRCAPSTLPSVADFCGQC
jgi:hypothetical protein